MRHRLLAIAVGLAALTAAMTARNNAASPNPPAAQRSDDSENAATVGRLNGSATDNPRSDPTIDDLVFAHFAPFKCDTHCTDDEAFAAIRSLNRSPVHTEVARRYILGLSQEDLARTCEPDHPLSVVATFALEIEQDHPTPESCRSILGRPVVSQIHVIDRLRHVGHIDDQTALRLASELATESTDARVLGVGYHALLLADDRSHLVDLALQRLDHIDSSESQEGSRLVSALATCAECRTSIQLHAPTHPVIARLTPRFMN